ncbi:MAG: hypothetical protein ACLQEQ_01230 [Nitrososphaerales archaeon]
MIPTKKRKDGAVSKKGREESRYIRMVRAIFKVCRRQGIPLYSSRFSRRDYTLWQHIALLALMQRVRKSYREFANDLLTVAGRLVRALGLSRIPHFTSMEKFMLRVPSTLLERVMGGFLSLTGARRQVLGVDSSGFSLHNASRYYALRVRRDILSAMQRQVARRRWY